MRHVWRTRQRGGLVQLAGKTLLDLPPQLGHINLRDHIFQEGPLQQAQGRLAIQSAGQHVKQHVVVELAGGGAVAAAHIIRVDLELRRQIEQSLAGQLNETAGLEVF